MTETVTEKTDKKKKPSEFSRGVLAAGSRALEAARKTAKFHGTELVFWRDGKVVHEKP